MSWCCTGADLQVHEFCPRAVASENFLTAVSPIFLMRNNFGIQLGDIIRIVFAVIIVMLAYSFLRFLFDIAQTIIVVILIYIIYKIIKAIL
ncbi:MAG: hypothetical protein C4B59_03910 [Candidatus Methanogaster sp.]|uniref:Uncharacterized protein n=1 Tax=Candidatus Methanogaster sp. TaxID=3386292 RepID=A0AC61L4J7_9EURY|nr:MAG: hypothetical protein C4B59_03910 [ANME-2 cluster archaeon]